MCFYLIFSYFIVNIEKIDEKNEKKLDMIFQKV